MTSLWESYGKYQSKPKKDYNGTEGFFRRFIEYNCKILIKNNYGLPASNIKFVKLSKYSLKNPSKSTRKFMKSKGFRNICKEFNVDSGYLIKLCDKIRKEKK